jgi:hypothetical protein
MGRVNEDSEHLNYTGMIFMQAKRIVRIGAFVCKMFETCGLGSELQNTGRKLGRPTPGHDLSKGFELGHDGE